MYGSEITLLSQAYDLPEAEPVIPAREGARGFAMPLSATGLHHWRTVLSMLSGNLQQTKVGPPTHPPWEPKSRPKNATVKRGYEVRSGEKRITLTPLHTPPSPTAVERWMNCRLAERQGGLSVSKSSPDVSLRRRDTSQLEGPTPQNSYGFKISQSALATSSDTHEVCTCGRGHSSDFRTLLISGHL